MSIMVTILPSKRKQLELFFLKSFTKPIKKIWIIKKRLKKMFNFFVAQLSKLNWFHYILIILIIFNFVQLLSQTNLVFFLAYKALFLFYTGCLILQLNIDIATFILWIVYGTYIIVVAALALMILPFIQNLHFNQQRTFFNNWWFCLLTISTLIWNLYNFQIHKLFIYTYINHYELLTLDNYNELEQLGWILGYTTLSWTIIITILLSISCIFIVFIITITKNFSIFNSLSLYFHRNIKFHSHLLKQQHFFLQENNKKIKKLTTNKNIIKKRY